MRSQRSLAPLLASGAGATPLRALVAALVLWLAWAPPARAAEEPAPAQAPAAEAPRTPPVPEDPLERGTPRGAMRGYLLASREGDLERAAEYLDLRAVPAAERAELGPELARQLKVVLDQKLWVDLDALSADPRGFLDDGLPAYRDLVGYVETERGDVPIYLQRVARGDGVSIWKVASATVERVPELYAVYGYGPLEEVLPPWMLAPVLFELSLWAWSALMGLILLAAALSWVVVMLLDRLLRPLTARTATDVDDRLVEATAGPLRFAAGIGIFHLGWQILTLPVPVRGFLVRVESALLIVAVAWFALRLVNLFTLLVMRRLEQRGLTSVTGVVPLGQKTVKVLVIGLAAIAMLSSFGFNVTALLAGLGVGGIAVALAAQKTIENVFGGVMILGDQPVRVGDFCRFGDRVGIVEEIGLRSTRIRTLDRTVVAIPNAEFASMQLENFAKRDRIWFNPRLGLRYETTPEQLRFVLVEIRKMLYAHPKVSPDPARIRFAGFGDYSLNLDVFAYVMVTDFGEYLGVAEDLNLRIMDIVAASGSGFAFPSQTLYLGRDGGLDPERAKGAEEAVRAWRESQQIFLPDFPEDRIRELGSTLPWPPPGSP
jgi:MscS family membrane protein